MVGDDDKDGVGKPGLAGGFAEEAPDGIVGVLDGGLAGVWLARDADLSRRISIGTVVARGHDLGEERLARSRIGIEDGETLAIDVFITDTPDVGESDAVGRDLITVDDGIAIVGEVVTHVVEVAVAAIDELGDITHPLQQAAHGAAAHAVVVLLDDAFAGRRRYAERKGF